MSDLPIPVQPTLPGPSRAPGPPLPFSWTRQPEDADSTRLALAGELDLVAQAEFKQALDGAQADSDRVILDLGALTLIDCACLFVVFSAAKRTRREGGLVLLNPQGQVRRVLALIGIPNGAVVTKYL